MYVLGEDGTEVLYLEPIDIAIEVFGSQDPVSRVVTQYDMWAYVDETEILEDVEEGEMEFW